MNIPTWKIISNSIRFDERLTIGTGYFACLQKYIDLGYAPISICGKAPDWYTGVQFKKLAPKWSFFSEWKSGKITNDEYIEHYCKEVLVSINFRTIGDDLLALVDKPKAVLLCYEKPGDFCHRHIVSYFLRNHSPYAIMEIPAHDTQKGLLSK